MPRRTRTILLAAALDADAMEFRDAREDGWDRGLELCHFVISDVITARLLPAGCTVRPLHVLAESSLDELREMLAHMTEPKVS